MAHQIQDDPMKCKYRRDWQNEYLIYPACLIDVPYMEQLPNALEDAALVDEDIRDWKFCPYCGNKIKWSKRPLYW